MAKARLKVRLRKPVKPKAIAAAPILVEQKDPRDYKGGTKPTVDNSDQFHIESALIPKGKSYQWVAVSILGEQQETNQFERNGWKAVPFKRHAKRFAGCNVNGTIVFRGLKLFERSSTETAASLSTNTLLAEWQDKQRKFGFFGSTGGARGSTNFTALADAFQKQGGPFASYPERMAIDVSVTLTLRLSASQHHAADVCGITPEVYAQRVVWLLASKDLSGFLLPNEGVFEVFDKMAVHVEANQ